MATPPFKYQPMFEKGKDTTEYYLLTKDYVSVSEFEGLRWLMLLFVMYHSCFVVRTTNKLLRF